MLREDEWEFFRGYPTKAEAIVVSKHLEIEGVPNDIQEHGVLTAGLAEYWIVVQCSLAHRARWLVAQLPPNDSELNYLATKKLGEV